MKCLNEEILQSYLDFECDSKERSVIERHLDQCSQCRTLMDEMKFEIEELKDNISLLAPTLIPPLKRLNNRSRVRRIWPLIPVSAASVILLILMMGRPNSDKFRSMELEQTVIEYLNGQDPNQLWKGESSLIIIEEKNGRLQVSQ